MREWILFTATVFLVASGIFLYELRLYSVEQDYNKRIKILEKRMGNMEFYLGFLEGNMK